MWENTWSKNRSVFIFLTKKLFLPHSYSSPIHLSHSKTFAPLPNALSHYEHAKKIHGIKRESSKKLTFGGDDDDGEVRIFLLHLFNLSSFAVSRLGFFPLFFWIRVSCLWSPPSFNFFVPLLISLSLYLSPLLRVSKVYLVFKGAFCKILFHVLSLDRPVLMLKPKTVFWT